MKHPRAADLTQLVKAVEKAGLTVAAVEVRWENQDGRETPTWRILTSPVEAKTATAPVDWQ